MNSAKRLSVILVCMMPLTGMAQGTSLNHNGKSQEFSPEHKVIGIEWAIGLAWEDVINKAKKENKYIFIDCFATWCKPCKVMDRDIYPNDTVGNYMNHNFISIKVQFDKTKSDNDKVKSWYSLVERFKSEYDIQSMPTFLFFSPDGNVVHKSTGKLTAQQFIVLASDAMDSSKQFFTLLRSYNNSNLNYKKFPYLSRLAMQIYKKDTAYKIAKSYVNGYLNSLNENELCTKENLEFINDFSSIISSTDQIFYLCYHNPRKVDKLFKSGFSKNLINKVIVTEEINPVINAAKLNGKAPKWRVISKIIRSKYGAQYEGVNLLNKKTEYYEHVKDWENYTTSLVQLVKKIGVEKYKGYGGAFALNNYAWEVFLYSSNQKEIKKALAWTNRALEIEENNPGIIDTKASLLYKLGKKQDAIKEQIKATSLFPADKELQDRLVKMRQGISTWIVPNR